MFKDFEQSIGDTSGGSFRPESPYVLVNTNPAHFCDGFHTAEEALAHLGLCERLRRKGLFLFGTSDSCSVCLSEELVKFLPEVTKASQKQICPFGDITGWADHSVRIVVPQGYKRENAE